MKTRFSLLGLVLIIPSFLVAENIKPLTVDRAVATGKSTRKYTVVHTVIRKNPNEKDSKPIIDRATINDVPTAVNKTLKVPDKLTDLQGEAGVNITQMTGLISQTIGTVGAAIPDPRAKAASAAASLAVGTLGTLVDQGLRIAGKVMDKYYGKDNTLISMIEILPAGYYTIDNATGKVSVTQAFENDLEKLVSLQARYQPALQAFTDAYLKLLKESKKAQIAAQNQDTTEEEEAAIKAKLTALKNDLVPLARTKVELEKQLANLQLYRIALMRWNLPKLGSCGEAGSGPAILRLFVFLGAKQTNVYDIPYCVPSANKALHANIEFVLPYFDNKGAYHDGGVKLVCSDGTVKFQGLTASQDLEYNYASSKVYNLYDAMITGEAEGYDQFLVPFNMYQLQAELDAQVKEADAKNYAKAKEDLAALSDEFKSTMKKAKKEGFAGFSSLKIEDVIKAVDTTAVEESVASADATSDADVVQETKAEQEPAEPGPSSSSSAIIEVDEPATEF